MITSYRVFSKLCKIGKQIMTPGVLSPRESGKFIAENAKLVKIHDAGIASLAKLFSEDLQRGDRDLKRFTQCSVHPSATDEDAANWIFLIDTLNFCFWSAKPQKWQVTVRGQAYTGYMALCAAIVRAKEEGVDITNPKYYSQISLKDLAHVLRGDDPAFGVPLLKERQDCLHQVGTLLLEQYDGDFKNCIKSCEGSAMKLLDLVVSKFKCFQDEAEYLGRRVAFYKRAQILIGDIWVCFQGKSLGSFKDIEDLTMFADYRVPQVLVHFKAMEYEKPLMEILQKDSVMETGCEEEIEIRGCSIHVVEKMVAEVRKLLPDVKTNTAEDAEEEGVCNAVTVDHFLWDYRRKYAEDLEYIPFHKTLSVFY